MLYQHPRHSAAFILMLAAVLAAGCGPKTVKTSAVTSLQAYVSEAKARAESSGSTEGSLWVDHGRRSDLFRDFRAHDVNDVVTIRVVETTQAVASADQKNSRATDVSAGINNLFGAEKKIKELPTMTSGKAAGKFEGTGSTTRATTLQTTLSARVTDVLPNGYLVVEGVREIRLNNEVQNVYLTGVVRPEDISRDNVVASSAVAQMTVRVQGRGAVSQPIKPGLLYKLLSGFSLF